jgi:hypothetical protein
MNFVLAITQFFARQFPGWGVCHFSFEPEEKALYIYCQAVEKRDVILENASVLASLDIGIEKYVVVHPDYFDVVIQNIRIN